jgi:pimeloyl-ACP methyl ester carboxylesterase
MGTRVEFVLAIPWTRGRAAKRKNRAVCSWGNIPSALSVAHRLDGQSWRDELNAAGFEVWGLDFIGYGGSDRYPEMSDSPEDRPALGRAATASSQIERAVEFITDYHHATRISIIGHS